MPERKERKSAKAEADGLNAGEAFYNRKIDALTQALIEPSSEYHRLILTEELEDALLKRTQNRRRIKFRDENPIGGE